MRRRRKAFSLVELLIVIGVLITLIGIVVVSLGKISSSSKAKATHLTMENLRSLQAEYESQTRRPLPSDGVPLDAPRDVSHPASDQWGRNGNATIRTQRILRQLLTVPTNRQAYNRLSLDQQMYPMWAPGVSYAIGDQVLDPNVSNRRLRCTAEHVSSGTAPSGGWTQMGNDEEFQAIPLDGWGNPIIFVPRGGLLIPGVPTPVRPSGQDRPFWASAGENGRFSGFGATAARDAQDNVYSFEN